MIENKQQILKLMYELQSRNISLIQQSAINYYLLAYAPKVYLNHQTLYRCVRKNLNNLANEGYLKKSKLANGRAIYSLTDEGLKVAKELN